MKSGKGTRLKIVSPTPPPPVGWKMFSIENYRLLKYWIIQKKSKRKLEIIHILRILNMMDELSA